MTILFIITANAGQNGMKVGKEQAGLHGKEDLVRCRCQAGSSSNALPHLRFLAGSQRLVSLKVILYQYLTHRPAVLARYEAWGDALLQ